MDPMWSVCRMRSKLTANGAQALAIEMHDAKVADECLLSRHVATADLAFDFRFR
jgi:hypothetical protein